MNKEKKFEKVVEWDYIDFYLMGIVMCVITIFLFLDMLISDSSKVKIIISTIFIFIFFVASAIMIYVSLNERQVYWREFK